VKINKPSWIVKSIIISSDSLYQSNNNVYSQVLLNSSNTVSIPIHSDNNESHNLEFKLVIGLGLNSSSFHTIVIPQLKVRKFA
jgi:hypothetical protein